MKKKLTRYFAVICFIVLLTGFTKSNSLFCTEAPPNVLFIIIDDLNCRVGCYGDTVALTPNIDRLASQGVLFENAYCQSPACNPSRSSVFSGKYPTSTGVLDNRTFLVVERGNETIQDYYSQHGYAVAEYGKIWHGPNRVLRPDEPKPDLTLEGINKTWYTPAERAQQQIEEPDYWETNTCAYRLMVLSQKKKDNYDHAQRIKPLKKNDPGLDSKIADSAIAALKRYKEQDSTFFLAVGFKKPHVPLRAPPHYYDLYDASKMPLPPDFDTIIKGPDNTPYYEYRDNNDLFMSGPFTPMEARIAMRAYYACISYTDAQVGRVLDELENLGLDDNTVIVLWSDHGWHLSEKGMWAKGTTFEVSSRSPMIFVDPRKNNAGRRTSRVVQFIDIYPTLTDLCGFGVPEGLEGRSLEPLLENPTMEWDHPAFTVQTREWHIGFSIRTEKWRYTEWDKGEQGMMLFDHENDTYETINLAYNPEYSDVVASLQQQLQAADFGQYSPYNTTIGNNVKAENLHNKMSLHPNPADDELNMRFVQSIRGQSCLFYIYSPQGQLLLTQEFKIEENKTVDIKNLPDGNYIAKAIIQGYSTSQVFNVLR